MNKAKEVTIYDIAEKLQLSVATVSRGLKNSDTVNKRTRKRILDLAEKMGYQSNHFARNLRQQRTNTIGVIVHELNTNFMTSVLTGIEKITAEAGYDIIIAHSSESFAKEAANAKNLFHKRVDGLIASLSFDTKGLDHFRPYVKKGIPVIFFDRVEQNGNNSVVIIDNYKCGYQATRHLIEQGCSRIAHVTASLNRNVYEQRYNGYRAALSDSGIVFDESWLLVKDLSKQAGLEAARKILAMSPLPDGIFFTNDFVASVCMRALKSEGIAVPDDIAIVGFNNDAISELMEPALTTISYPGRDMGEIAAKNLINHLKGVYDINQTNCIIIRAELIIRQSSLKNKAIC